MNENMFTRERYKLIEDYLKKESRATVDELAKMLYVSPATVRRDLTEMEKMGQIKRTHGGAIYNDSCVISTCSQNITIYSFLGCVPVLIRACFCLLTWCIVDDSPAFDDGNTILVSQVCTTQSIIEVLVNVIYFNH